MDTKNDNMKKPEYYYLPRFNHFNIYKRCADGTTEKYDEAMTREQARDMVYRLNGWKIKSKS